ncbi:MAG: PilZ domain-containing protein, partial [Dehalococcoidia bacterium]|nr:PilZ domain-containing protein [Dehalococcoidia bacterium]
FVRLSARLKTTCQVLGAENPLATLTKDVSGGGMSLFTKAQMAPGTVVGLDVRFPGREGSIRFTAQVMWSGELISETPGPEGARFETGVRFLDIAPEDHAFILRYAEHPPARPGP